eukprot:4582275-Amphidinium_carterae.1
MHQCIQHDPYPNVSNDSSSSHDRRVLRVLNSTRTSLGGHGGTNDMGYSSSESARARCMRLDEDNLELGNKSDGKQSHTSSPSLSGLNST